MRAPRALSDYRPVIALAYPVVFSTLATTLMGLTDMLFMGLVSTEAQGGVGLGAIVTWACAAFFVGTLTVINTFVAQYVGAGSATRCGGVVWHGLALAATFSLLVVPLAPQVPRLVELFGAPAAVTEICASFVVIRVAGLPAFFVETCLTSFLRGTGDTRTPMKIAIGVVLLNIPLNVWFVFGGLGVPPLGAAGSAYATVLAQSVGALVLLAVVLRRTLRRAYATGWPRHLAPHELVSMLRVGLPIGVSWFLEIAVWTVFGAFASRFGKEALAAHNIVMQVLHVSFMPGVALSVAATTLVGQRIGARDPAGAARDGYTALKLAMIYMGAMGVVFLVGGGLIAAGFNRDPQVIALARRLFVLAAAFQLFDAMGMVCGGILRGAGDTRFPMLATIGFSWFVFLPCIWLLGSRLGWGVVGSWVGATVYIIGLGVVLLGRVLSGRWRGTSVADVGAVNRGAEPAAERGGAPP